MAAELYARGAIPGPEALVVKADDSLVEVQRLIPTGLLQNSRRKAVFYEKIGMGSHKWRFERVS